LSAATDFTANGLNLTITGSKGADTIQAGGGTQTIIGNGGGDTLIAGTGADTFKDTTTNFALDTISNFGAADTIDITNFKPSATKPTTASWANGILTVSQGTKTETIALTGNFTGTFAAASDGAAGTDITYTPPAGPHAALVQAMASFGVSGSGELPSPPIVPDQSASHSGLAVAHG
jgi:hypothetical protein